MMRRLLWTMISLGMAVTLAMGTLSVAGAEVVSGTGGDATLTAAAVQPADDDDCDEDGNDCDDEDDNKGKDDNNGNGGGDGRGRDRDCDPDEEDCDDRGGACESDRGVISRVVCRVRKG